MVRLHEILIGISLIALVATPYLMLAKEATDTYGAETIDNNDTKFLNKSFNKLNATVVSTQQRLQGLEGNPDFLDIVGAFFAGAFGALLVLTGSFGIMVGLVIGAVALLPIGGISALVIGTFTVTLMIIVFVAVVLKTVLGGGGDSI